MTPPATAADMAVSSLSPKLMVGGSSAEQPRPASANTPIPATACGAVRQTRLLVILRASPAPSSEAAMASATCGRNMVPYWLLDRP